MKKTYEKPSTSITALSSDDNTNLTYVSQVIAPVSGGLKNKITKLNS